MADDPKSSDKPRRGRPPGSKNAAKPAAAPAKRAQRKPASNGNGNLIDSLDPKARVAIRTAVAALLVDNGVSGQSKIDGELAEFERAANAVSQGLSSR